MAFRLKLDESMEDGIRRIGLEQIDRALTHVDSTTDDAKRAAAADPIRSVHETRKCLKRVRALLKFGRPLLAKPVYREFQHAARDLGRTLSGARDLDVLDHTLTRLQTASALKPATLERLHRTLNAMRAESVSDTVDASPAVPLADGLRAMRERLLVIPIEVVGRSLVTDGLARSLDECRAQFALAFESDDGDAFHDWRKTVQIHWRHMQLVQRAWPEYCRARLTEAKAISVLVGDDRDLALLQAFAAERALPQTALRDIDKAVARIGPGYRREARARGERLLSEGSNGLARRLAGFWSQAQTLRKLAAADGRPATGAGD